jgi:hypothetical protein
LIAEGVEAGEFAAGEPEALADLLGLACCGVFHPAMIADCSEVDSEEKVRGLARLLVRGLRATNGEVIPLPKSGG